MAEKNVNGQPEPEQPPVTETDAVEAPVPEADTDGEALTGELEKIREQLLRQAAEFQNYRRRVERDSRALRERGRLDVIEPMLQVLDDFRRALDASAQVEQQETSGPAYRALRDGVELVYQNFSDVLKKLGVEYIDAVGAPFDESQHEAMMQMPAPEGTAPGTVLEEIQRGYRLGDRVVRHSKVVVAA